MPRPFRHIAVIPWILLLLSCSIFFGVFVAFFLRLGQTCSSIFFRFYFFADKQLPLPTFPFLLMCVRTMKEGTGKKGKEMGMNVGTAAGFVCLRATALGVSEFYSNLTLIKWHVTGLSSVTRRKRKWRCQMRKECTSGKHVWSRVRYREHYLREVKGSKETFV